MTLKQRKEVSNLPKFNEGLDKLGKPFTWLEFVGKPNLSTKLNIDISNTGSKLDYSNAAQLPGQAILFGGDVAGAFGSVLTSNEVLSNAGTSERNIAGISYQYLNNADYDTENKRLNTTGNTLKAAGSGAALGASIGSIFPGAGTLIGGAIGGVVGGITGAIGGIFRSNKLKDRIRIANMTAQRTNSFNRAGAVGEAATQNYYSKYGDTTDDILYANRGKDLKQPIK